MHPYVGFVAMLVAALLLHPGFVVVSFAMLFWLPP